MFGVIKRCCAPEKEYVEMSKISVELLSEDANPGYISEGLLTDVTAGCLRALNCLGKIGEMIEVFKITFTSLAGPWGTDSGPVFTVHFRDPLGNMGSHTTDFRFIRGKSGEKKPTTHPPVEDIADHLHEMLRQYLFEHARKARGRLDEMTTQITGYISSAT
jgi:hypothetical protein